MIPFEISSGPIGAEAFSEELLLALLRLQGEGGYATDEESARVLELLAQSHALGDGVAALEAVLWNAYPQFAEELLAQHEQALRLPNDAARTIAERQERIRAILAMVPNGSSVQLLTALERLIGSAPTLVTTTAVDAEDAGSEPRGAFQGALVQASGWTQKARRAAELLLRRQLPAWAYGHQGHFDPGEMLVKQAGLTWGVSFTMGQGAIQALPDTMWSPVHVPARVKDYSPLSRISARDLNAIQDAISCAPFPGSGNEALQNGLGGARVFFFSAAAASGVTTVLVNGFDARQRYVRCIFADAATDIRPGQAADGNCLGLREFMWATMTGVASQPIATNVAFGSSSTQITITNTSGATRYVVGVFIVSPVMNAGTRDSRTTTFVDDVDTSGLNAALWSGMADTMPTAANGAGADAWVGYPTTARGAEHRAFALATTTRPGANANAYVLDTSIDWRDRIVCVLPISGAAPSADPLFPGVTGDEIDASQMALFYSGPGITTGVAALSSYEVPLGNVVRIAVRSSDGALVLQHHTGSAFAFAMSLGMIIASDQLSKNGAAKTPLAVIATPVDASTSLDPGHLNFIQDGSIQSQAQQGDGASEIAAMPLGPVKRGHTNTPIEWTETRRRGRVGDSLRSRRQPVAGRLRRYFAVTVTAGATVVLDTENDWRDRLLHMYFVVSTSDITPGGASEASINTIAPVQQWRGVYTGDGYDGAGTGLVFAGAHPNALRIEIASASGALSVINGTASTQYLVGFVEGSFPLGPRSV